MIPRITASMVLYNTPIRFVRNAAQSFLDTRLADSLVVIDNSPTELADHTFHDERVVYRWHPENLGYGRAHNQAFRLLPRRRDYHLVVNPDVEFSPTVLAHLVRRMDRERDAGIVMPRINYPDGSLQPLCKLLPTPLDLVIRRFGTPDIRKWWNKRYELNDLPQDSVSSVPTLSGCFMFVRSTIFEALGGFDERFFLYLEDVDLVRRIGDRYRVLYDPTTNIVHHYAKGSYSNLRQLKLHVASAIKYFNKWGWLYDRTRTTRNATALRQRQAVTSRNTAS